MNAQLSPGDRFPTLLGESVDNGEFEIPGDLDGGTNVVLIYRGHW